MPTAQEIFLCTFKHYISNSHIYPETVTDGVSVHMVWTRPYMVKRSGQFSHMSRWRDCYISSKERAGTTKCRHLYSTGDALSLQASHSATSRKKSSRYIVASGFSLSFFVTASAHLLDRLLWCISSAAWCNALGIENDLPTLHSIQNIGACTSGASVPNRL